MKYCSKCGRELFDKDIECDKCKSTDFISEKECKEIIQEINNANMISKNEEYFDRIKKHTIIKPEKLSIPKCPTCGSTNIRKMGGVERGASIAAFGIFSKKINKTFKCSNCGYTW